MSKKNNNKLPSDQVFVLMFLIIFFRIIPVVQFFNGYNFLTDAFSCDNPSNRFTCHGGWMLFIYFFIPIFFAKGIYKYNKDYFYNVWEKLQKIFRRK